MNEENGLERVDREERVSERASEWAERMEREETWCI